MRAGAMMRVSADRKLLTGIRDFVRGHAIAGGASPNEINDLIQAVDEAATNIIVHGYNDQAGIIEIEIRKKPGLITVFLRDNAPPFDPTLVPTPDIHLPLDKRPIGGLGIHLIRHCVDEFHHDFRKDGGNELVLVKYLRESKA